jgi:hypothetical protein
LDATCSGSLEHTATPNQLSIHRIHRTLQGQPYTGVSTWRRVFELVCRQLAEADPDRFRSLPENPKFITKHGHRGFSTEPGKLRVGSPIAEGVYAEVHFSANDLRDSIKRLLTEFGIGPENMVIYLREDRDVEERNA